MAIMDLMELPMTTPAMDSLNMAMSLMGGGTVPEHPGLDLAVMKVGILLAMTLTTIFFGMVPLIIINQLRNNIDRNSRSRWRSVISFSSCFSGGVFMGACLLDLIPDVEEIFKKVLCDVKAEYGVEVTFPVAPFSVVLGFGLILIIEQAVLHFQEQLVVRVREERQPLIHSTPGHNHRGRRTGSVVQGVSDEVHHDGDGHTDHQHINHGAFQHSSLRSILLLIALSFHSVFEGLAIGLQTETREMLAIFMAVMMHKAVMAFSLGLNIAQSSLSVRAFVFSSITFSLSSPLGVAIGIGLSGLPPSISQQICNGVLQGIAGGTFLYITFFEVLPHELNIPSKRLWKVFFVILGFAVFCVTLIGHGHGHGHGLGHAHQHRGIKEM